MAKYTITFERIGRTHDVAPLATDAATLDILETKILKYARPHLRSRDVEVIIDDAGDCGFIACGMHSGGKFKIQATA